MKKLFFIILIIVLNNYTLKVFAQQNKVKCCLLKSDLVGTWQRNTDVIGAGLGQNFQFLNNGTFVLNLCDSHEDARSVIKIKGYYRLTDNKLFFTIVSRTIVNSKLHIAEAAVSNAIFEFDHSKEIEIKEANPKELTDPCYITLFNPKKIELSNELYYKIKL